jgi:hypothetical protein
VGDLGNELDVLSLGDGFKGAVKHSLPCFGMLATQFELAVSEPYLRV